jgi:hypothetical protein
LLRLENAAAKLRCYRRPLTPSLLLRKAGVPIAVVKHPKVTEFVRAIVIGTYLVPRAARRATTTGDHSQRGRTSPRSNWMTRK